MFLPQRPAAAQRRRRGKPRDATHIGSEGTGCGSVNSEDGAIVEEDVGAGVEYWIKCDLSVYG
jgi:hypothetical protein